MTTHLKKIEKILTTETSIYGGVISDAGTPLISDPGFKLVRYLLENNVNIISLPEPIQLQLL